MSTLAWIVRSKAGQSNRHPNPSQLRASDSARNCQSATCCPPSWSLHHRRRRGVGLGNAIITVMTALDLAEYTGFLIRRAQQVHAALWLREASTEITSVQFGALNLLQLFPGIDQRTLGEHLQLDRSTIADVSRRLEQRGYIERDRDPADRRRNILRLTPGGLAALADMQPRVNRVNQTLVSALSEADRAELHRLLNALLTSPQITGLVG
jgi:DNA-binding MarR family transcriptional regulator